MPGRLRRRYTTFLVAVASGRPGKARSKAPGPAVYAVMKPGPEEALEAVRALTDPDAAVAIVGSLSTRIAKTLKLKPDEPRVV